MSRGINDPGDTVTSLYQLLIISKHRTAKVGPKLEEVIVG